MADLDLYEDLYGDVDMGGDTLGQATSNPASPTVLAAAPATLNAAASAGLGPPSGTTPNLQPISSGPPAPTTFSIATYEDSVGPSHSYKPAPNQPPRGDWGDSGGGVGGGAYGGGEQRQGFRGPGPVFTGTKPSDMPDEGKIFVGGLNWETSDDGLKQYFAQFGPVVHCTIMRDPPTGRSRGFAFLTFADPSTVNKVMVQEHWLDGKLIDPKRALPRGGGHGRDGEGARRGKYDDVPLSSNKLFVRGMPDDATPETFRAFWSQYATAAKIMEAVLMMDRDSGRHRGFGFVNLETGEEADKLLKHVPFVMEGHPLEVKKAQNRARRDREEDTKPTGNTSNAMVANNIGTVPAAGGGTPFDPVTMANFFKNLGPTWKSWTPALLFGGGMMGGGMGMGGMNMGNGGGGMGGIGNMGNTAVGAGGGGFGGGGGGPMRTQRGGPSYQPY